MGEMAAIFLQAMEPLAVPPQRVLVRSNLRAGPRGWQRAS